MHLYKHAIITILIDKIEQAINETGINEVAIAGGVSANSGLRKTLLSLEKKGCKIYIPPFEYCTDNAAMIAITGYYKYCAVSLANKILLLKHDYKFNCL